MQDFRRDAARYWQSKLPSIDAVKVDMLSLTDEVYWQHVQLEAVSYIHILSNSQFTNTLSLLNDTSKFNQGIDRIGIEEDCLGIKRVEFISKGSQFKDEDEDLSDSFWRWVMFKDRKEIKSLVVESDVRNRPLA